MESHFHNFESGRGRSIGWNKATLDRWLQVKSELKLAMKQQFFLDSDKDRLSSGITPDEVVHDDKISVDAILRRQSINSQKDLWHKCKNIQRKFVDELVNLKRSPRSVEEAEFVEDLELLTVQILKSWLRNHSSAVGGTKTILVQRITGLRGLQSQSATQNGVSSNRRLAYPECSQYNLADKLKTWIYTCCQRNADRIKDIVGGFRAGEDDAHMVTIDICNAANHWAGLHSICRVLLGEPRLCCRFQDLNAPPVDKYYEEGSPTHIAIGEFLKKHITATNMRHYTRARHYYMNETFNFVINKYATKKDTFRQIT
ncbi:hypothetical protein R1sor_013315 [Riccia sorocarpa]|uniref:Uncharacterized protein n=1 Tax=Riccia sorocarpa TaxID=122646 RepID=A0ABD3H827_9MARC